jgi:hypothetical protein
VRTQRIDARDVLDVNARTAVSFRARVVGRFPRTGPNSWDDYVFQRVVSSTLRACRSTVALAG